MASVTVAGRSVTLLFGPPHAPCVFDSGWCDALTNYDARCVRLLQISHKNIDAGTAQSSLGDDYAAGGDDDGGE